jgi:hypothetical protein
LAREYKEDLYGAREASFEEKASGDSLTGVGSRRDVFGDGGWCIGNDDTDGRDDFARPGAAFGGYA